MNQFEPTQLPDLLREDELDELQQLLDESMESEA